MTDMNETTEVMMKTDRRGRLRYTAQQKQAFLEAFESSGLSGPQFASLHGVHYQTLVSWLRKRSPTVIGGAGIAAFTSLLVLVGGRRWLGGGGDFPGGCQPYTKGQAF
jgi:hypothetical protein